MANMATYPRLRRLYLPSLEARSDRSERAELLPASHAGRLLPAAAGALLVWPGALSLSLHVS